MSGTVSRETALTSCPPVLKGESGLSRLASFGLPHTLPKISVQWLAVPIWLRSAWPKDSARVVCSGEVRSWPRRHAAKLGESGRLRSGRRLLEAGHASIPAGPIVPPHSAALHSTLSRRLPFLHYCTSASVPATSGIRRADRPQGRLWLGLIARSGAAAHPARVRLVSAPVRRVHPGPTPARRAHSVCRARARGRGPLLARLYGTTVLPAGEGRLITSPFLKGRASRRVRLLEKVLLPR